MKTHSKWKIGHVTVRIMESKSGDTFFLQFKLEDADKFSEYADTFETSSGAAWAALGVLEELIK